MDLKFFQGFVVFIVVFLGVIWLIERTAFDEKAAKKIVNKKYFKSTLFFILLFSGFLLEFTKQNLNQHLGKNNFLSTILGAIMFAIYFKFFPHIFQKKKNNKNY